MFLSMIAGNVISTREDYDRHILIFFLLSSLNQVTTNHHCTASTLMNATLTYTTVHLMHIATTPSVLTRADVSPDSLETGSIALISTNVNRTLVRLTVTVRTLRGPTSVPAGRATPETATYAW